MKAQENSRILVVEDDLLQSYIAKKVLSGRYDVECVNNGYDAMEILENKDFQIILMDINLGDAEMDGIRVMRNLRQHKRFKHTKIVAVTAHAHLRDWYISEGFNDLIIKPIVSETVFDILEHLPDIGNKYCCV
ncbi:MAG: response regulator [Bacteroidota bacterium]